MRSIGSVVLGALLVCMPLQAAGAPVIRSGDVVPVEETQEVQDDFYAAGNTVTVSGDVEGDLYAAGWTVVVQGDVSDDAVIAGGSVRIGGAIGGDVRILAGELWVGGEVKGDVLAAGGVVHILPDAAVEGDVLFAGGEVIIEGEVGGSVSGRAQTLRLDGPVRGSVSVTAAEPVVLGDRAHIEGTLTYTSIADLARAPGSVVTGDVVKREVPPESFRPNLLGILALFFTTLLYTFIGRTSLERFLRRTLARPVRHGLIGLFAALAAPLAAIALIITLIGIPAGAALLLLYLFALVISFPLGGALAAAALARRFDGEVSLTLKWTLLGTAAFSLVSAIPYIGLPLAAIVMFVVLGGMGASVYAGLRS